MSHFGVPDSLGENPFPEVDRRHAKWKEFSAANRKGVAHLISGLQDLQHVVDKTTYSEWRVRHPEAPEAYDPDQVAGWLGRDGLVLIRVRFDTIAAEAVDQFIQGPDDLHYARRIVENLATAMRLTFGGPGIIDCDAWKERKMRLVSDLIENINLPPRRWRIDPYDRDRLEEKRATPLIVRLMKACRTEFDHDRQAVDACLDLLCKEGLSADKENISFLGNALTTLCERLEIEALSNRRPEEATLFAKLQVQFQKLADDGFGECIAVGSPVTPASTVPKLVPTSGSGDAPAADDSLNRKGSAETNPIAGEKQINSPQRTQSEATESDAAGSQSASIADATKVKDGARTRPLSARDANVHDLVGEGNFRTLTNTEIMRDRGIKLRATFQFRPGEDAPKCCLDRIRKARGYPLSREITKKRSSLQ